MCLLKLAGSTAAPGMKGLADAIISCSSPWVLIAAVAFHIVLILLPQMAFEQLLAHICRAKISFGMHSNRRRWAQIES
jgi:hypothetical protein